MNHNHNNGNNNNNNNGMISTSHTTNGTNNYQHRRLIDRLRDNDIDLESLILWQGSSNLLSYQDLFLELMKSLKNNTSVKNVDIELIRLHGLSDINKIMFFETIGKLRNLQDLFLRNYSHDFRLEVSVLSYCLAYSKQLLSLRLFAVKLYGSLQEFSQFGTILSELTNLKMFEFYFAGSSIIQLDTFVTMALSKLPSLEIIRIKSLCLGNTSLLSTQSINLLCSSFQKTLKELTLRYLALGDDQIRGVIQALKNTTTTTSGGVKNNNYHQYPLNTKQQLDVVPMDDPTATPTTTTSSSIEYVELQGNQLGNKGIIQLANEVLYTNHTLIHLDLSRNFLGDDAVISIANALRYNSTLKHLNLMNNNSANSNTTIPNNNNNNNNNNNDNNNNNNTTTTTPKKDPNHEQKFTVKGYRALVDMLEHYNFTLQELKLDFPIQYMDKDDNTTDDNNNKEEEPGQQQSASQQQQSSISSSSRQQPQQYRPDPPLQQLQQQQQQQADQTITALSSMTSYSSSPLSSLYDHTSNQNVYNNNSYYSNTTRNPPTNNRNPMNNYRYPNSINNKNNNNMTDRKTNESSRIQAKIAFFLKLNKDIIVTKLVPVIQTTTNETTKKSKNNTDDNNSKTGDDLYDDSLDNNQEDCSTSSTGSESSSNNFASEMTVADIDLSEHSSTSSSGGNDASNHNNDNVEDCILPSSCPQTTQQEEQQQQQQQQVMTQVMTIISSRSILKKENAATKEEWMNALIYRGRNDLSILFYFLRANPTLCYCE